MKNVSFVFHEAVNPGFNKDVNPSAISRDVTRWSSTEEVDHTETGPPGWKGQFLR